MRHSSCDQNISYNITLGVSSGTGRTLLVHGGRQGRQVKVHTETGGVRRLPADLLQGGTDYFPSQLCSSIAE